MANRYQFFNPGYDPTQDQRPPRRESLTGCLLMIGGLLVCAVVSGFMLSTRAASDRQVAETAAALTLTVSPTLDAWALTGTALYWNTFTPTATFTETPTETPTGTLTASPTPTATADNWQATGTAIFLTLNPALQLELVGTPYVPTLDPNSVAAWSLTQTARPPTSGGSSSTGSGAPIIVNQPPASNAPVGSTGGNPEPPLPIIVTRVIEVPAPPIVVTATLTATHTPTPTQTATATFTETPTPTHTATPSETPTATFTATFTPSPTGTPTETPTATPSATHTPTPTETETPTP